MDYKSSNRLLSTYGITLNSKFYIRELMVKKPLWPIASIRKEDFEKWNRNYNNFFMSNKVFTSELVDTLFPLE